MYEYGYFRRCYDLPHEQNFVLCDFRHAIQTGRGYIHYDILLNEPDGVVYDGMTFIKASQEQADRTVLYTHLNNFIRQMY